MKIVILFFNFLLMLTNNLFTQKTDSLETFVLPSIEIVAQREIPFVEKHKYGTDYNSNLLNQNGYSLIRRGLNFTQDLYVEGFKKGDIKVVVDGEYYHNACPNRMDAPATRINILDMESVVLTKSASLNGTGLYGKVEYHRSELDDNSKIISMINGSSGASKDLDLSIAGTGLNSSLGFRLATGKPYLNGDRKSFKDLYGYKQDYNFYYYNSSLRHRIKNYDLEFGVYFTYGKDISFPYLKMDERFSKVGSMYLKYKSHKIYFNYTDHLMNNELRNSSMFMETKAKNLTAGLSGNFYEVYYRNWNANNLIQMMSNSITNKLMPDVVQTGFNISHKIMLDEFNLFVKGGIQYQTFRESSRKSFYEELYSVVKTKRYFVSSGVTLSYSKQLMNNFIGGLTADFATDSPEAEQLYIAVKRMMNNPDWSGNPNLNQPFRIGLRNALSYKYINMEFFGNYILNYVDIVKKVKSTGKSALTYENTNALIAGINIGIKFLGFESNLSYLWGENTRTKKRLAEIAPLSLNTVLSIPLMNKLELILHHQYENAQKRINPVLNEFITPAWNNLSIGLSYLIYDVKFDLHIHNLLNHNYYRFTSYSRDPFSAGLPVYEPGRYVSLTVYFNKLF